MKCEIFVVTDTTIEIINVSANFYFFTGKLMKIANYLITILERFS